MIELTAGADNSRELRDVFARFPSGVTAICALGEQTPIGMAASAFVAVSLAPPLASVCIQRSSTTWPQLRSCARLGVSFLGESHDSIARQLAHQTEDRFEGVRWNAASSGAIFIEEATGWLECEVAQEYEAGDHFIALLRILGLKSNPGVNPLVFHSSRFYSSVPR